MAERARRAGRLPGSKLHALSHCILGHHGPDTLPGRRFRSPEALALYRLNALDAAVKGALEHGLRLSSSLAALVSPAVVSDDGILPCSIACATGCRAWS